MQNIAHYLSTQDKFRTGALGSCMHNFLGINLAYTKLGSGGEETGHFYKQLENAGHTTVVKQTLTLMVKSISAVQKLTDKKKLARMLGKPKPFTLKDYQLFSTG